MSKVKTALKKKTAEETVTFARSVVTKMTGNATFPTPAPALTALTTKADDLDAAITAAETARASSKQATSAVKDKRTALNAALIQEAAYVQSASAGDQTKIESAGFEVASPNEPIGALPAPENVQLDANVDPGHMSIRWKPVRGAASYIIERAQDGENLNYMAADTPTAAKALVNTMVSGQRYWFRIAAVNTDGRGEWTLPVSKIAP